MLEISQFDTASILRLGGGAGNQRRLGFWWRRVERSGDKQATFTSVSLCNKNTTY